MGPVGDKKERSLGDPPFFNHAGDAQSCLLKVARWADYVYEAGHKGEDKRLKTICATLGQTLYESGLSQAQKSMVERKIVNGVVNLKQEDQLQAMKEIVAVIANDHPISVVSRLILSLNRVMGCHRKNNEKLQVFVSRFHGLPSEHLMIAEKSPSSPAGEVIAITFLKRKPSSINSYKRKE